MAEEKTSVQEEKWDIVIKPKDKLFSVDFKELWAYRDLCSLFVKRNIITQYKQTILGPAWFVIQPALTVIMYMIVFGGIAGIPTDGVPRPLFYLAGTAMWNYFADCLTKTSNTFVSNSGIFGKVYFPRLVMPISTVLTNLISLSIQFLMFLCFRESCHRAAHKGKRSLQRHKHRAADYADPCPVLLSPC